jgi:hypothetical protein
MPIRGAFLLTTLAWVDASVLFVDSAAGNDMASGEIGSPFKTIQRCVDLASDSSTCYLREGTFHESVLIRGKRGLRISAFESESVVIDGTIPLIGGWMHLGDGLYQSNAPQSVWQLFAGSEPMTLARFPNALAFTERVWGHKNATGWRAGTTKATPNHMADDETVYSYNGTSGRLKDAGVSFSGCPVVLNTGHWQTHTSTIRNHTAGTSEFDYEEETDFDTLCCDGHAKYFVEGCEAALDTEGEWAYGTADPTRLLFRPPATPGVHHSSFDFSSLRGKNQSYALAFDDCEAVSVAGVTFHATTLVMWESPSSAVTDCKFLYPSYSRRALGEVGRNGKTTGLTARPLNDPLILPQFADTPNFQGFGVSTLDSGVAGTWFGTKWTGEAGRGDGCNLTITRNTFWRTDGMALYLRSCGGALIEHNSFREISYSGTSGTGEYGVININTSPVCTVRRNFFGTSGPSETIVLGRRGTLVELNYFTDNGHCQEDGYAVHAYTAGQNFAMIRQNWVIDSVLG